MMGMDRDGYGWMVGRKCCLFLLKFDIVDILMMICREMSLFRLDQRGFLLTRHCNEIIDVSPGICSRTFRIDPIFHDGGDTGFPSHDSHVQPYTGDRFHIKNHSCTQLSMASLRQASDSQSSKGTEALKGKRYLERCPGINKGMPMV